jgi:protein-tyrosine phosphatase
MLRVGQVRPYLFFGSAPQGREDIEELTRHGVTAVLCLETDGDIAEYGLRWSQLEDWYAERGITTRRVPILDFSPDAIVAHLDDALGSLAALLRDGHAVYVHCSEGINRSPTIAIAHLVRAEGLSIAGALTVVRTASSSVQPYAQALEAIVPRRA